MFIFFQTTKYTLTVRPPEDWHVTNSVLPHGIIPGLHPCLCSKPKHPDCLNCYLPLTVGREEINCIPGRGTCAFLLHNPSACSDSKMTIIFLIWKTAGAVHHCFELQMD